MYQFNDIFIITEYANGVDQSAHARWFSSSIYRQEGNNPDRAECVHPGASSPAP
jgi:hypothetical protein